jgi:hypothetical protein
MVLGGQGADAQGKYRFGDKRKAICEMKHFDAYSVEDGRLRRGPSVIMPPPFSFIGRIHIRGTNRSDE